MTRRQRRRKKRDLIEALRARHSPDRLGTRRVCCPQYGPALGARARCHQVD